MRELPFAEQRHHVALDARDLDRVVLAQDAHRNGVHAPALAASAAETTKDLVVLAERRAEPVEL